MKGWSAAALGGVVGALVVAFLAFSLGSDDPARRADASVSELTPAHCLDVVPDSAFETLGWRGGDPAREHAGRCERSGEDGYVTVGDLAVVASAADRPEAARRLYEERCSGLFGGDAATPDLRTDWLPEGSTACARLLPAGQDTGLAQLFLLTDAGEVVHVRLGALVPTTEEALQDGLAALVAAAERQW